MLPKRKLIKKQYIARINKDKNNEDETFNDIEDIPSQIKSLDESVKSDAISTIANLPQIPAQITDPSCLHILINLLNVHTNPSIVHTTLYALINIFELQSNKTVKVCFQMGLDKCLMALWSSAQQKKLLKPMIQLMTSVVSSGQLPQKYNEMVDGLQRAVFTVANLQDKQIYQQLLEFLVVSEFEIHTNQQLSQKNYQIQTLIKILQLDQFYKPRALAIKLLVQITKGYNHDYNNFLRSTLDQFLNDIDLEQEYRSNILVSATSLQVNSQMAEGDIEEQDKIIKNQKNNKIEFNGEAYKHLIDAMEGLQIMLQICVDSFTEEKQDYEDIQEDDNMQEQQMIQEQQQNYTECNTNITEIVKQCLIKNRIFLTKFAKLSFIEGNCITELLFQLILCIPQNILSQITTKDQLICLTETSIISLSKTYAGISVNQGFTSRSLPKQVFYFNLDLMFSVIIKFKHIFNRNIYVDLPTLNFADNTQNILPINLETRACWMSLLQIFSMFYNPQKFPQTSLDENKKIGFILKAMLINIPQMQMQEWRGQCIDTVFDVYSNQNFDGVLLEYGFPQILDHILKMMSGTQIKNTKRNKFVKAVFKDLGRFIEYKKKMCVNWVSK